MNLTHDPAAVIDYWRAIEIFSPQKIPKAAPNDQREPVFVADQALPLPWEADHALLRRSPPKNMSRRFTVYCGVLATAAVRVVLESKFGTDAESSDERTDGETCLFAFSVTDDGRPLFDTFVMSSCAWGTARTLDPTPTSSEWLIGFEKYALIASSDFEHNHAVVADDTRGKELLSEGCNIGRTCNYADLLTQTERIANHLGILHLIPEVEIRIRCGLVASSRKYSGDDNDFINSFYLKDLARVADEAREGNVGRGLSAFLAREPKLSARIDICQSTDVLFQQLSPSLFPRGRWPSKEHHPLVFSQQFAINTMTQELGVDADAIGGIFAVNGPPGTGKTTLLRDLVASVVVERATRLSELARPEDAFKGEARWKTDKYTRVVSLWEEQFQGFEIVVASANNGAVENISHEIPGVDAVDASWLDEIDYFSGFGTRLLDAPAWAMVAARLGNKSNCAEFVSCLWYGSKEEPFSSTDMSVNGLLNWLKSIEGQAFDWHEATAQFKAVVAQEQSVRQAREQIFMAYKRSIALEGEVLAAREMLDSFMLVRQGALDGLRELEGERDMLSRKVTEALGERRHHREFRPGFIEIIFSLGRAFREWRAINRSLYSRFEAAQQVLATASELCEAQAAKLAALTKQERKLRTGLQRLCDEQTAVVEQLQHAKRQLGSAFPAVEQWHQDEDARELSAPWADAAWNEARAQVFLAALRLHKAFVMANPSTMRKSLQAAMDVLARVAPSDAPPEAVRAAWTTLFFLVPVVSTTFASFDRLFSHLGRESLGWLLIDEAGQAAPQLAVGAIWRARRSVVVGDPMQLEPVVTIPFTAQQALRRYFQVSETWLPGRTSVQQLTDRVSRYGTMLKAADDPIWVGSPLRVHRRCDQPMFGISNAIAYSGLMVFGTAKRSPIGLQPSQWIHVAGGDADGHWIEQEGQAVVELIEHLLDAGVLPQEIFLISPFRVVVDRLRQLAQRAQGIQVGTIHTVQGKESDVAILVLGGNPSKPGAKRWASQRPNLLNVAASRARRRLYVIGHREAWRRYPYFRECAALLAPPK